jgi:hypothetical protein
MYSSYSFSTSALDGVSGQRHGPAALHPWGKDPRYPLDTADRQPAQTAPASHDVLKWLEAKHCLPTVRKHVRQTVCKHCLPTMFVGVCTA